jgi:squalene-associated FAD-dependent desaturase
MTAVTHIIGAGLAGLSAAVALAGRGRRVIVHEATAQAGGRCRSYHDPVLDMVLDNGNHLILSGNRATFGYLRAIGSEDRLVGPANAWLAFHDRRDGTAWTIRPNLGPAPWWLLSPGRRVPGTRAADYLQIVGLLTPGKTARVDEAMACGGVLWDRLLEPFLLSALNTEATSASAALAGAVIRGSLARGGRAYRTRIAHPTLSAAFIDPALDFLKAHGAEVRFGDPIRGLNLGGKAASALATDEGPITLGPGDRVILAVPPWVAQDLIPGQEAPDRFNAIVNGHFAYPAPPNAASIVGVIGGEAQWIFAFPDRLSITVSGADEAMTGADKADLARRFWADIAAVHKLPSALPPWRIIKERRATFAATPEQAAKRPSAGTPWRNLFLAGDWTATGLPATIEGAIRSGQFAARLTIDRRPT